MTYIPGVVIISGSNTVIVDSSGSLKTVMEQFVITDPLNSSTANLSGSGTPIGGCFTGSAASTLGVAGIQVSLKADKNCTVIVEQSPDGINWDISDEYIYHYSVAGGFGITVQALNSFVRIKVRNDQTTPTTYFRLQTALCPIVEALPRSLTVEGNLKVAVNEFKGYLDSEVEVTPMGDMRTQTPVKLVGTTFSGNIVDNNFWVTSSTGAAPLVTQAGGQITLSVASGSATASVQSVRYARYSAGTSNYYRSQVRVPTQSGSCIQRWGAYDTASGYFFQNSASVFQIGYRNAGVDTLVSNGSFNGEDGNIYDVDTNVNTYEMYWTNKSTWYVVSDTLVHKAIGLIAPLSDAVTLPVRTEIINAVGNNNTNTLIKRVASINRLGTLYANPIASNQSTAGTYILKRGAGHLQRVSVNDIATAGTITLYDSIGAATNIVASISILSKTVQPFTLEYQMPLSFGLTVVLSANTNCTIIYE